MFFIPSRSKHLLFILPKLRPFLLKSFSSLLSSTPSHVYKHPRYTLKYSEVFTVDYDSFMIHYRFIYYTAMLKDSEV